MASDLELLREFSERRSEEAFALLVRRHLDLVHTAAVRMTGQRPLAEEVAQGVFLALAQQAPQVAGKVGKGMPLSAWLHVITRNLAAKLVRSEVRRRAREHASLDMRPDLEPASSGAAEWDRIAVHLDRCLGELSEADRHVVLLRYFEGKTAGEIARHLGIAEDAARKRVLRALDRLRSHLAGTAPGLTSSALSVLLGAWGVQQAPAALAGTIVHAAAALAIPGPGAAASAGALAWFREALPGVLMTHKPWITTGIVAAALALPIAYQSRELRALQRTLPVAGPADSGWAVVAGAASPPPVATAGGTGTGTGAETGGRREGGDAEGAEIARLGTRAEALRRAIAERRAAQAALVPAPGRVGPLLLQPGRVVPLSELVEAGADSPEAAAQTMLVHLRDANLEAIWGMLLVSPEERAEAEALLFGDPAAREPLLQRLKAEFGRLLTVELTGVEAVSERRRAVSLKRATGTETNELKMVFGRTSSGWRQIR